MEQAEMEIKQQGKWRFYEKQPGMSRTKEKGDIPNFLIISTRKIWG